MGCYKKFHKIFYEAHLINEKERTVQACWPKIASIRIRGRSNVPIHNFFFCQFLRLHVPTQRAAFRKFTVAFLSC